MRFLLLLMPILFLAAMPVSSAIAQTTRPSDQSTKDYTHSSIVTRMMAFDKNQDGKLTRDEITDARLLRLFDEADVNKTGVVTPEDPYPVWPAADGPKLVIAPMFLLYDYSFRPDDIAAADGVVNATPIGMSGFPGNPVPVDALRAGHWVADVIYSPIETELIRAARVRGARVVTGGGMCVWQGVDAFRLFTGIAPDAARMHRVFASALAARDRALAGVS